MKPRNRGIWGSISNPCLIIPLLFIHLFTIFTSISRHAFSSSKEWEEVPFKGSKVLIRRDPLTGTPRVIKGLHSNILEYAKKMNFVAKEINEAGKGFIGDLTPVLKIDPKDLETKAIDKVDGDWFVSYWQLYRGVLIYESSIGFSMDSKGNIHSLGAIIYPDIEMDVKPKMSEQEALKIVFRHLEKKDFKLLASRLIIYPKREGRRISFDLVYVLNLFPAKSNMKQPFLEGGGYAYFIHAKNGKIVHHEEIMSLLGCCAPYEEKK